MFVNLGCGKTIWSAPWCNVDRVALDGVDAVVELDQPHPGLLVADFDRAGIAEVTVWHLSHLVEHISHPLPLFEAMWRVSTPDAVAVVRCPYGSSDDAWSDPTHVRPVFHGFWGYLGQPHHWMADGGYRGDWRATSIQLGIDDPSLEALDDDELWTLVQRARNVVREQFVTLQPVKPAREPLGASQEPVSVRLVRLNSDGFGVPSGVAGVFDAVYSR